MQMTAVNVEGVCLRNIPGMAGGEKGSATLIHCRRFTSFSHWPVTKIRLKQTGESVRRTHYLLACTPEAPLNQLRDQSQFFFASVSLESALFSKSSQYAKYLFIYFVFFYFVIFAVGTNTALHNSERFTESFRNIFFLLLAQMQQPCNLT